MFREYRLCVASVTSSIRISKLINVHGYGQKRKLIFHTSTNNKSAEDNTNDCKVKGFILRFLDMTFKISKAVSFKSDIY